MKLTDFGLARSLLPGERATTNCGTDEYIPPELLTRQGVGCGTGDWWALGVMMYELRAGTTPFAQLEAASKRGENIFYLIIKRDPLYEPARLFPAELAQLLHGLLAKEPSKRLADNTSNSPPPAREDEDVTSGGDGSGATRSTCTAHSSSGGIRAQPFFSSVPWGLAGRYAPSWSADAVLRSVGKSSADNGDSAGDGDGDGDGADAVMATGGVDGGGGGLAHTVSEVGRAVDGEASRAAATMGHSEGSLSAKEQKQFDLFSSYWDEGASGGGGEAADDDEACVIS